MQRCLALVVLTLCACSKTAPEPEKTPAPPAPPASAAGSSAPASAEDVVWTAPASWQSMPNPNTMRKATYKVPRAAGDAEDGELTVSAAMGGADANIKRWAGQFGNAEPKTEARTVNGLKLTLAEIKGTFASGGMMGGPTTAKTGYMLLGAVVDAGARQYFFKLTGPEKTVAAARPDFDAFVASLHAK